MKLIKRDEYLNKLIDVMGTPDIKVITGVRRSGKSKLMEAFKDYLETSVEDSNIIHINYNLPEYEDIAEYKELYRYVNDRFKPDCTNYVLIDEVQMCKGFEKAINGMHASEKFDIYITGSNAFLLSSDLATLFTGRTFEIRMFPFSFEEYIRYYDAEERIYDAFDEYLENGGMPGSYLYKNIEDRYTYLEEVFNTLILRDIRDKYKIRNVDLMDRITDFMMDNVSNLSSARSVADSLASSKDKINHKTVGQYIQYLCNAFLFYRIRRYDIRGKKYLSTNDKYYLVDTGFRYAKLGTKNMDYGRVVENIVAIDLLRRGYEVYVGVLYKKEIDFVAVKRDKKIYIQVSDYIGDSKTFEREVAPLLEIKDAYPKMVLARTRHKPYDYEGISVMDVADWLKGEE